MYNMNILVILICVFINVISQVAGANHKCYVCVPNTGSSISEVFQLFPQGTIIPQCNQFHPDKEEFVKECPSPSYQGCLTQTNGTHVTKTCTEVGIEDCKTANKIKYCYCKDNLCNKESVPAEASPPPADVSADDDEDSQESSEGSGSAETSDSRQEETSSQADLDIEDVQRHLTTSSKSSVLTTPRPGGADPRKASAGRPAQPLTLIPFLLILRALLSSPY